MRIRLLDATLIGALAVLGIIGHPAQASAQALVQNGSFENAPAPPGGAGFAASIASWTETTGCGIEIWNGFIRTADTFSRLVELDSNCNSRIEQTVYTVPGQRYRLNYAFAARPGTPLASNAMNVFIDGAPVASHTAINDDYTSWRHFSYEFVAATGSTVIAFAGAGTSDSVGSLLDSVSLGALQSPPTFSLPFPAPSGTSCICSPLLMNTQAAATQTWRVKALGGPLTITVSAFAVNPAEPGNVVARIFDTSNGALVGTLNPSFPVGTAQGTEIPASTTLAAAPGAVYGIQITTPGLPQFVQGTHYKFKIENAEALGTGSPSSPSFEHDYQKFFFNVGNEGALDIRVFVTGTPSGSATVNYTLVDPSGATTTGSVSATSSNPNAPPNPAPVDGLISVPGAAPGVWALIIDDPTGHFGLDKQTGADRGIYFTWQSKGEGSVHLAVQDGNAGGGALFGQPVEIVVYNLLTNEEVFRTFVTGELAVPEAEAGHYRMHVNVPPGFGVAPQDFEFDIVCDRNTELAIVITDVAPPVIDPLPDLALEAGPGGGAVATWTATATDPGRGPVPVVCVPPSGSTFPLGVTTVTCNAVDAAGNAAQPVTFTVTVRDTVAPVAACTPSFNPSGGNIPKASRLNEDGFYRIGGSDNLGAVTLTLGSYVIANGETIKLTQAPGQQGVALVNTMGKLSVRHFRVGAGDPVVTATDGSGNTGTQVCLVPPPPK